MGVATSRRRIKRFYKLIHSASHAEYLHIHGRQDTNDKYSVINGYFIWGVFRLARRRLAITPAQTLQLREFTQEETVWAVVTYRRHSSHGAGSIYNLILLIFLPPHTDVR